MSGSRQPKGPRFVLVIQERRLWTNNIHISGGARACFSGRDERRRDEFSRGAKACFSIRDEQRQFDVSRGSKACFSSRDERRQDEISRGAKVCFAGHNEICLNDVSKGVKACFSDLGYQRGICLVLGLFDYFEKIIQLVVSVL